MQRFSANLSILFTELPFIERFAAAKQAGFAGVECWSPYEVPIPRLQSLLSDLELTLVGINTTHGEASEWGLAAVPGREAAFERSLDQALDYAQNLGGAAVHVLAGLVGHLPRLEATRCYYANLEKALRRAEGSGVRLLIEPLNGRDRPGYFLCSIDQAADIIDRAGLHDLRLMFDCYHVQVQDGDVVTRLNRHFAKIGHIQIAGAPWRGEPDRSELHYPTVVREIDRLGWKGWIGAEYRPSTPTSDSFVWLQALRQQGLA
jgi:2-dehydrotetronate isomerase